MKRTLLLLLVSTALLVRHQTSRSAGEHLRMMILPPRASVKKVRGGAVTRGVHTLWQINQINTRLARASVPTSTGTSLWFRARRQYGGKSSPNQLIDSFSSIATTNETCDGDDDATFPKSAEAAAASGRELIDGAPGRDPDHLWQRCGYYSGLN